MPEYIEDAADTFDYATDWVEVAEDTERGGLNCADTQQEDVLYGYIPWNKRRSALRFFRGFAVPWEPAGVLRLHREQPHAHPDFPQMRCVAVSFKGVVVKSNDANANLSPYDRTPFDDDSITRRTKYNFALAAVHYRALGDVWFLDDAGIVTANDEWLRNTLFLPPQPTVEALTVTGGLSQLTFSEGGGTGPTAGTTKFGAPMAELQSKVGFKVHWMNVPWEYVSSDDSMFWPQKILDCVGRLNSDTIFNTVEPETVLMEPPEFELFPWWVPSDDPSEPLIGANITLSFRWFDPPTGIGPPFRKGWNNMPWGGNGTTTGGDGKYYRATRDGTNAGRGLLEAVPMAGIFSHVLS